MTKVLESSILKNVDFEQEETLNFDMLEHLVLNKHVTKYATYLETLLSQIRETKNYEFVSKFIETDTSSRDQFVISLNEHWPNFFCSALHDQGLSSPQLKQFSIKTLLLTEANTLQAINQDNCLTNYISQSPDYLVIENPVIAKLISRFIDLSVAFTSLDYEASHKGLFNQVYENALYDLNFENIALMLREQYGIHNEEDIRNQNYSLIQSLENSPLSKYVSENIERYLEVLLSNCSGNITDDQNAVLEILNNKAIGKELKKQYVQLLSMQITELSMVLEKDLWTILLNQGVAKFSVKNLVSYFQAYGFDDNLLRFLNEDQSDSDYSALFEDFDDDTALNFFNAVSINNDIANDKYSKILVGLNYYFEDYEAREITDDKFKILIDEQILPMNVESLQFVRDYYEQHLLNFIQINFAEYIKILTPEMFSLEEILEILRWDVENPLKLKLLNLTNEKISIIDKGYSDEVNAHIIARNLKVDEKKSLFEQYHLYGEKAQSAIEKTASESLQEIILNNLRVNSKLLSRLIQSDDLSQQVKTDLFIRAIPTLDMQECTNHLIELGYEEMKGVFEKGSGRRNYPINSDITRFLDAFKSKGWIFDYRDDERNNERVIILKNKPRNK